MLDVKYEIKVNISCEIMQKVSKKDKELSAESLLTYICTCIYVLFIKFTKHSLGNPNVLFMSIWYKNISINVMHELGQM